MSEIKLPFTEKVGKIIFAVIIVVALGGYMLYFSAKGKFSAQEQEVTEWKDKFNVTDKMLTDMKGKYDAAYEDMKKLLDDLQLHKLKYQDCQSKLSALQVQYDAISQNQNNSANSSTSGTAAPTSNAPAVNAPASPPSATPNTQNTPSSAPAPASVQPVGFQCPTSDVVNAKINQGNWDEQNLSWWVDYSARPLNDNEKLGSLTKILFDGKTVACYYALGLNTDQSWLILKASSKQGAIHPLEGHGWSKCTTSDCQFMCDEASLGQCFFDIKKP